MAKDSLHSNGSSVDPQTLFKLVKARFESMTPDDKKRYIEPLKDQETPEPLTRERFIMYDLMLRERDWLRTEMIVHALRDHLPTMEPQSVEYKMSIKLLELTYLACHRKVQKEALETLSQYVRLGDDATRYRFFEFSNNVFDKALTDVRECFVEAVARISHALVKDQIRLSEPEAHEFTQLVTRLFDETFLYTRSKTVAATGSFASICPELIDDILIYLPKVLKDRQEGKLHFRKDLRGSIDALRVAILDTREDSSDEIYEGRVNVLLKFYDTLARAHNWGDHLDSLEKIVKAYETMPEYRSELRKIFYREIPNNIPDDVRVSIEGYEDLMDEFDGIDRANLYVVPNRPSADRVPASQEIAQHSGLVAER